MSSSSLFDGSSFATGRQTNPGDFGLRYLLLGDYRLASGRIRRVTSLVTDRADDIFREYEGGHRTLTNQIVHIVGLAACWFAFLTAASWPRLHLAGFDLTPAHAALTTVLTWYFSLNPRVGTAALFLFLPLFFPANRAGELPIFSGMPPGLAVVAGAVGTGLALILAGHRIERSEFLPERRLALLLVGPAYFIALFLRAIGVDGGLVQRWRQADIR